MIFDTQLAAIKPGQSITYHAGNLGRAMNIRGKRTPQDQRAVEMGKAAMRAYIRGEVELVQRRLTVDACEYVAIKRHTIRPPTDKEFVPPIWYQAEQKVLHT